MVRLTDEVGQEVQSEDGSRLGTVRDLVARIGTGPPRVTRLLFGPGERPTVGVAWRSVRHEHPGLIVLDQEPELDPMGATVALDIEADEILLGRDVLDTQVVDVRGRWLVRAGDVLLDRQGPDLVVVGIELSSSSTLTRIGLQRISGRRQQVVPWEDLHLTSLQGRSAQLAGSTPLFELTVNDLARVVANLSTAHAGELFERLDATTVAGVLRVSSPPQARRLLTSIPAEQVDAVLAALPPGRAASARRLLVEIAAHRRRATGPEGRP